MTTTQNDLAQAAPGPGPLPGPAAAPAAAAVRAHPVLRVPPAPPAVAAAHFAASLAFHTDVSDVAAALAAHREEGAELGFQLVDSRSTPSWDQAHVPGAVHLPTALVPERAGSLLDRNIPVVTYCWGPGCNGAARTALALAELGYQVKEMLGGIEYWIREGYEVETRQGRERRAGADPLTAPTGSNDCGC
ncbi:sulfurtransferase [Streptomyces sp. CB00455]|uniref:rhodanese-like domain-containing protein n=1 Tax=Streptomyces sp. CB00455 TaxID=1703927 RepID=UPI00093B2FD8|nr:rhodanese-like domain-containing protein [Streptomyces sp. CB00455]OKK17642.1 sulfurtransferase [Streptomyces sp. CB00455]